LFSLIFLFLFIFMVLTPRVISSSFTPKIIESLHI
jgi:hypothetical protein